MCGIFGMASFAEPLACLHRLSMMELALRHRGPDGSGRRVWSHVALGATELRIRDRAGPHQPFGDPAGRVWLIGNGEIYNAAELRRHYSTYPFTTGNDLETIIPLYLEHGAGAVARLEGMFAVAIWDDRARVLLLARDRAGEKPLFWTRAGREIWFASEIQALLPGPDGRRPTLDAQAAEDYRVFGCIREPRSPFQGIRRVPAASLLSVSARGVREERYWDPERLPPEAIDRSADVQLTELVAQAVERQVVGESPVGVFLSGGVDSSLLTVLAARALGPDRLAAFTVRFPDRDYDESADAASVACRAGVRHVTVTADDDALCNALREVTTRVAEPIADPAVLPTLLLARAARSHGAVALAGEGADELFGGYPTYLGHRLAPAWQRLPRPVRSAVERAVQRLPQSAGKVPLEYLARRFVAEAGRPPLERHVAWFGAGLGAAATALLEREAVQQGDPVELAMAFDYRTFLRDGLLVKLDRATMLASLEARAPYLDRAVTEFALRLPPQLKVRGLTTKWVLKRAARRHLPPATVRRRKRGLSVPVARLLRTRLRAEVERLLAPERLDSEALLPVPRAAQLLSAHLSGQANYGRALYAVLAWSLWKEHWLGE